MEQSKVTSALGGAGQGASAGAAFGPYGAAIGGVIGGVGGFLSGGGEDDAEKLAEEQAQLLLSYEAENQRRMGMDMAVELGANKAASYASGIQYDGSTRRYQEAIGSNWRRDMAWSRFGTKKQVEMVRAGGEMAGDAIKMGGIGSMLKGATSVAGAFNFGKGAAIAAPSTASIGAQPKFTPGTMIPSNALNTSSITSGFKVG